MSNSSNETSGNSQLESNDSHQGGLALYQVPEIYARRWFLLGVLCTSLVLVVMSVSGVNVALPRMGRELNASFSQLQWIVDVYALVFAGMLLTAGSIGDRYGRRKALLAGLLVFALGALVGGLAQSPGQVVLGRVIMGVGAAFVMPSTLSLIATIFPPEERKRAIAIWAGFAGAGGAIGPIATGLLLQWFWWGSALLLNIFVVAVVLALMFKTLPESVADHAPRLDPLGAVLSMATLGSLVYAIIEGPTKGWTDAAVLGGFVIAAVGLVGFIVWEGRYPHPMLPLSFFKTRRFSVGCGVITLAFFAMFGFFFMITQYLQWVRGDSALIAGLSTLPLAFALVMVSPRSAGLAERFSTRTVTAVGFGFLAAGFFLLSVVSPSTPYWQLALTFVVLGCGMGVCVAPSTGNIMSSVPPEKAGVGSAVNDTTRELGGALGIAILGSVLNSSYRSNLGDLKALGVPETIETQIKSSMGAAIEISRHLGVAGTELAHRAGVAFTDAVGSASMAAAVVAIVGCLVVLVFSKD